jgi:hypothetical protein
MEKGGGIVYDERQPAGRQLRPGFFFGGESNELGPLIIYSERCEERK